MVLISKSFNTQYIKNSYRWQYNIFMINEDYTQTFFPNSPSHVNVFYVPVDADVVVGFPNEKPVELVVVVPVFPNENPVTAKSL